MNISRKGGISSPLTALFTALLTLVLVLSTFSFVASARNDWVETDTDFQTTEVLKPIDPVFINDGNDTIEIVAGNSWFLTYDLRLDREYHAFLVGDFVINDSDPVTDYDVYTYLPNGEDFTTHTESAGLPEQIANDAAHQYFVPPQSGEYTFEIRHDDRDSENETEPLPAIFMLIEHIDVNEWYCQKLEGRDSQDARAPRGVTSSAPPRIP